MTSITAQIHIDTTSAPQHTLPTSPIPLADGAQTLTPSTELRIPTSSSPSSNKPDQLAGLADAMDQTRANLNQVLTSWKDWIGKEDSATTTAPTKNKAASASNQGEQDDDEEDDEEDQEE